MTQNSIDEIDTEEMQDQAPEDIIRERPIRKTNISTIVPYSSQPRTKSNPIQYIHSRATTHLSCEMAFPEASPSTPSNLAFFPLEFLFPVEPLVCMRKLAVRTSCPIAAQKPLRKALKGCKHPSC